MMKRIVFIITLTILSLSNLDGQEYFVKTGDYPPIDLSNISADAYEPGIFLIRIMRELENELPDQEIIADENGFAVTGIQSLDNLNRAFNVRSYKPLYEGLYYPGSKSNEFRDRHRAWGFHLWFELICDDETEVIDAVIAFQSLPEVELAEPEFKKRLIGAINPDTLVNVVKEIMDNTDWIPNDPEYSEQWHYDKIAMPQAWEIDKGRSNVIVAVIDDGIQYNHPDIAGNMWSGIGRNFVNNNNTIYPGFHGTHVAGTIAAVTNNSLGVAGIAGGSGTGNGIRLMTCQVFREQNGTQGGFTTAFTWAADNGAAISQNSWGFEDPNYFPNSYKQAIDYFNQHGGGSVMSNGITIFAAGNDNSSANYYPGYYSGVLAVAATNEYDQKSSYSNYGSWVDISAPGDWVLSTSTNNGYGYSSGTSMACPHVSGVAALLVSHATRYGVILSRTNVWNLLVNNVDNHYPQNPNYIGQLGSGRLNAHLALLGFPSYLPANIVLSSPNTSGTYTASQSVTMNPGFESGTSFVAQVYGVSKGNVIEIFSGGKLITSFVIDVENLSVYPDLWNGTDASGNKAEPGEYMYRILLHDEEIETGSFIIE
jgi:subtilisin family serine protease